MELTELKEYLIDCVLNDDNSDELIKGINVVFEQAEFAKTYYNAFLESRHINENMRISHNDQYFLYAEANRLLGEPNGKKLNE